MATYAVVALLLCAVFALHTVTGVYLPCMGSADSSFSGVCFKPKDCPPHLRIRTAPCAQAGRVCCNGYTMKPPKCLSVGGQCELKSNCPPRLWHPRGTDCPAGHTCCIHTY